MRGICICFIVLFSACLPAPQFKGVVDQGHDPGIDVAEDLQAQEQVVGDEAQKDISDQDVSEVAEEEGFEEGILGDVPDVAHEERVEMAEGWVCQNDEDCIEILGQPGVCEIVFCNNGQCQKGFAPEGALCPDDNNPCTTDQCSAEHKCVHSPIVCENPPPNRCDGNVLVTYGFPGTCVQGQCSYQETEHVCEKGCTVIAGVPQCVGEDPCKGVLCNNPQSPCLKSEGTCINGSCFYEYDDGAPCDDSDACTTQDYCLQGVCLGIPLECDEPPLPYCRDQKTLVTFAGQGECIAGQCVYAEKEVTCDWLCVTDREGKGVCLGEGTCISDGDCPPLASPCFKQGKCLSGKCSYAYNDGAACDDGYKCTIADTCKQGECVGTQLQCNQPPEPSCVDIRHKKVYDKTGTCDETQGECVYGYTIEECPASHWCTFGKCTTEGMIVSGYFGGGGGTTEKVFTLGGALGGFVVGAECGDKNTKINIKIGF